MEFDGDLVFLKIPDGVNKNNFVLDAVEAIKRETGASIDYIGKGTLGMMFDDVMFQNEIFPDDLASGICFNRRQLDEWALKN